MRALQTYALLFSYGTVFGADDPPSSQTVIENYAATQTTTITFPILAAEWANVAAMAGNIESDLTNEMKTQVETQCTTFSDDWPTYTFSLADLGLVYTEDFTEPNVGVTFSVSIDVKYEIQKATRKKRAIISEDVGTDTGYRVTELVNAAATTFASSVTTTKFSTTKDGTATVSTSYDDATVEEDVDACISAPCAGTCTDIRGSDATVTGRDCEVDACVDNPCSTDAVINVQYTCTDIAGEDNTAAGRTAGSA